MNRSNTDAEAAHQRLHDLRLRGVADAVDDALEAALVEAGLMRRDGGRVALTQAGLARDATWARLPAGSPGEVAARRAYARFPVHNRRFLEAVTRWQLTPAGVLNDHFDIDYDLDVIARVDTLVAAATRDLRELGGLVPRFAGYERRLEEPLRRAERGEHRWLASPAVESVHTVWMQLHADLLDALGAARGDEEAMP